MTIIHIVISMAGVAPSDSSGTIIKQEVYFPLGGKGDHILLITSVFSTMAPWHACFLFSDGFTAFRSVDLMK